MKKLAALFSAILMIFSLAACGEMNFDLSSSNEPETNLSQSDDTDVTPEQEYEETSEDTTEKSEETTKKAEEDTEVHIVETKAPETTRSETTTAAADTTDGIRPEFKEAMDSYEAFYTEYCEFMKEYSENPTDLTLLAKYAGMLLKAEEMTKAFDTWDESELSNEELKYYLDVNNRVTKMLVDVAG